MNLQPDTLAFSSDCLFFHILLSERVFGIYRVLLSSLSLQPKPQFLKRPMDPLRGVLAQWGACAEHTNANIHSSGSESSRQAFGVA